MTGTLKLTAAQAMLIDKIYFTSAGNTPYETLLYTATLAEIGLAYDDISVTPVIRTGPERIAIPVQFDSAISNGTSTTVTSETTNKIKVLTSGSGFAAGGGDLVECLDVNGVSLGTTITVSLATNTLTLSDEFTGVHTVRLMIGWAAFFIGTDVYKWAYIGVYKSSGDNYPEEFDVEIS